MPFTLRPSDLNDTNWQDEADKVGAAAPPPPSPEIAITLTGTIDWLDTVAAAITRFGQLDFSVPDGYWLEASKAAATLAVHPTKPVLFRWLNGGSTPNVVPNSGSPVVTGDLFDLKHRTGESRAPAAGTRHAVALPCRQGHAVAAPDRARGAAAADHAVTARPGCLVR
jgi:hypothetical protein